MIGKEQVVAALAAILDAIEKHEASRPDQEREIVAIQYKDLVEKNWDLEDYKSDPVGAALRRGIRHIGEKAAQHFDLGEMQQIAEEAAGEAEFGVRVNILDKNWDGIKDKNGNVWAA